ncbi:hypothetical protein [Kitasatospora griseola]|uniref:hypothetical protein n=1 Tax=Kitasatospora griseola TaxID=2064 RepID=UPI0034348E8A
MTSARSAPAAMPVDARPAVPCRSTTAHGSVDDALSRPLHALGAFAHLVAVRELRPMWNAGPAPARMIEIISPARVEHFFREPAAMLADGPPQPEGAVPALAAEYVRGRVRAARLAVRRHLGRRPASDLLRRRRAPPAAGVLAASEQVTAPVAGGSEVEHPAVRLGDALLP